MHESCDTSAPGLIYRLCCYSAFRPVLSAYRLRTCSLAMASTKDTSLSKVSGRCSTQTFAADSNAMSFQAHSLTNQANLLMSNVTGTGNKSDPVILQQALDAFEQGTTLFEQASKDIRDHGVRCLPSRRLTGRR